MKSRQINKRKRKSRKSVVITENLLQRVLNSEGRGKYANTLVYYLAEHIVSNNTTIEVSLAVLLPPDISSVMIYLLRKIQDIKINTERRILDLIVPSIYITKNVVSNIVSFTMPKFKFSYLESCIIMLSKLLIVMAILKNENPSYISTLRKKLKV